MNKQVSPAEKWDLYYNKLADISRRLAAENGVEKTDVACSFCGQTDADPLFEKHGMHYVQCRHCGLIRLQPLPNAQLLDRLYNTPEIREFFFNEILLDFAEAGQTQIFADRLAQIKQLLGHTPNPVSLLDIGCAAGNFLQAARTQGFRCTGLELHQTYIDFAQNRRGLDVRKQTVTDLIGAGDRFDVVTMWDVFEHVRAPFELLKEINQVLKPGGIFAFSTINHACFNARLLKKEWRYYLPPDHLYSFTPEILHQMLAGSGFAERDVEHQYVWDVLVEGLRRKNVPFFDPARVLNETVPRLGRMPGLPARLLKYGLIVTMRALLWPVSGWIKLMNRRHSGDLITIFAQKMPPQEIDR